MALLPLSPGELSQTPTLFSSFMGSADRSYKTVGELLVIYRERSKTLRAHDDQALKWSDGAKEFVATTRIKRSAFNMTSFESMVSDDVDIEIDAVVRRAQ